MKKGVGRKGGGGGRGEKGKRGKRRGGGGWDVMYCTIYIFPFI